MQPNESGVYDALLLMREYDRKQKPLPEDVNGNTENYLREIGANEAADFLVDIRNRSPKWFGEMSVFDKKTGRMLATVSVNSGYVLWVDFYIWRDGFLFKRRVKNKKIKFYQKEEKK